MQTTPNPARSPHNADASTVGRGESGPPAAQPRMQARVVGSGPPLVLVGGGLTGWKSWEPHAEQLAATRTVARLQLLNVQHGLEDRPLPEGYSVRMESRALAAALDHLGWAGPLDLAAWSYGGAVSLDFALNHPERIRSLTLIEPPASWVLPDRGDGDPEVQALRQLSRDLTDGVDASHLERFVRIAALSPPDVDPRDLPQWPLWMEHRRSLRSGEAPFDHRDELARLRAFERPVLLVTGTGTSTFLRRIHDALAANLPRARALEMPEGHVPHIASIDRFLEELARFQEGAGNGAPEGAGARKGEEGEEGVGAARSARDDAGAA